MVNEQIIGTPLIYYFLKLRFPSVPKKEVVIVWANKIYSARPISEDVLEHEKVHIKQQGGTNWGAIKWYLKYFVSSKFRLNQEIEAYRAQYQFIKRKWSEQKAEKLLELIASYLSGPTYGKIISYSKALKEIQNPSPSLRIVEKKMR